MAALVRSPLHFHSKCAQYYVRSRILPLRRASSFTGTNLKCCQLDKRGLVRVSGTDSVKLLQGLVTNNVELFHQDTTLKTMYCMVLNAQGRVLYDTMLYKDKTSSQTPSFIVECDKNVVNSLSKLLKMYKLRSKVSISSLEDVVPWVVFSNDQDDSPLPDITSDHVISVGKDPRTKHLGWRLLVSQGATPLELLQGATEGDQAAYEIHRVKLGISEGTDEIKPGVALPLEYNLDYVNGGNYTLGPNKKMCVSCCMKNIIGVSRLDFFLTKFDAPIESKVKHNYSK